jgi:hypothetical protein
VADATLFFPFVYATDSSSGLSSDDLSKNKTECQIRIEKKNDNGMGSCWTGWPERMFFAYVKSTRLLDGLSRPVGDWRRASEAELTPEVLPYLR